MFFLHLILALLLPAGITPYHSVVLPIDQEEYCNERYGFCVTYPSDYFSEKAYADNGDGITMYAQDRRIEVDITGAYNIMDWSVQEIIDNYVEAVRKKPMALEVLELQADKNYGWAKIQYNYETQLVRINSLEDTYITTIITVPASIPVVLEELADAIQLSFPL